MRRSKDSKDISNGIESMGLAFVQESGAVKVQGMLGKLIPKGSAVSAVDMVGTGKTVALFNASATVAFVKTGTLGVSAPTGGVDGICLKPNDYTVIAMGLDTHVIASTATVFVYEVRDESVYV